jgi:hypothetical protein
MKTARRREEKMKKDEKDEQTRTISLPQPSPSELRGRQSVRATFRLSERAVEALSIVSFHLGIKQKSLFDHLLEDMDALNLIAERFKSAEFTQPNRMQKTYVLSRRTLSSLDRVAKSFDTPRDALVEYSIQRLLPVIAKEREKHRLRKEVFAEMTQFLRAGEQMLKNARDRLGEEDPVYDRFETAFSVLLNAHNDIRSFVERGEIIEDF